MAPSSCNGSRTLTDFPFTSSERKFALLSQTSLPPPKKGSVCSAAMVERIAEAAPSTLSAVPSMISSPNSPASAGASFWASSAASRFTLASSEPTIARMLAVAVLVLALGTAGYAVMRQVGPESSVYRSQPENAPAAPIHHKKFRHCRKVAVSGASMLPAESFPRPRLPPNAAWKCSRARADNWHEPISKCIARFLHSTSRESHQHKIDEERDGRSRAQVDYRKIFVLDYGE